MNERLYRSTKAAGDGHTAPGRTARTLGVRPGIDIRRPPEHGGTGKDLIWELDIADLGDELVYREDPLMPGVHGFVEPVLPTTFDAYELALLETRRAWRLP